MLGVPLSTGCTCGSMSRTKNAYVRIMSPTAETYKICYDTNQVNVIITFRRIQTKLEITESALMRSTCPTKIPKGAHVHSGGARKHFDPQPAHSAFILRTSASAYTSAKSTSANSTEATYKINPASDMQMIRYMQIYLFFKTARSVR